ncbi:MAG: hypothetical protein F6K08_25615 [Okeania sp. SIO1H6]|nr:hypothetical protein [Okeania sp. SIO1H6]
MNQAPIHTRDKMIEKLEEWKGKNFEIFWLPTYSPKRNLIEILGKFIKYEWIEIDETRKLEKFRKAISKKCLII